MDVADPAALDRKVLREIEQRLFYYIAHPAEIEARLGELDLEWDVERALEGGASGLVLGGFVLGRVVGRLFLGVPFVVGAFLLQHAISGWSPPAEALRRMGYRTRNEIDTERYALRALRGDFERLSSLEEHANPVLTRPRELIEAMR